MTAFANTLRRLAPRTSAQQCAHSAQNSSFATLNRILKSTDRKFRCHRIIVVHHQRRKTGPQNYSPEVQTLFNIHNPSQDHRDRGACGFLLTT
ncbi:MAG: hypothetical protein RB191_02295 [Terriglobia bacterium]|nr:hypothetical protein [Terriglobia bacterium]